jgi:hypothetical protein
MKGSTVHHLHSAAVAAGRLDVLPMSLRSPLQSLPDLSLAAARPRDVAVDRLATARNNATENFRRSRSDPGNQMDENANLMMNSFTTMKNSFNQIQRTGQAIQDPCEYIIQCVGI